VTISTVEVRYNDFEEKKSSPLEATGTNDLLLRQGTEDAGNNFESWVFIILFETVIFSNFLTVL